MAMAMAMIYPEPEKGGIRVKGQQGAVSETKTASKISDARLSQARAILRYSQDLAQQVMNGTKHFDEALQEAQEAIKRRQSSEAVLAELHELAPDLAVLVDEERLSLSEAASALKQRQAEAASIEQNKRETILRLSEGAWHFATAWAADGFSADVEARLADNEFCRQWLERIRCEPKRLADIKRGAEAFSQLLARIIEGNDNV